MDRTCVQAEFMDKRIIVERGFRYLAVVRSSHGGRPWRRWSYMTILLFLAASKVHGDAAADDGQVAGAPLPPVVWSMRSVLTHDC
jgi:hypothetical protein